MTDAPKRIWKCAGCGLQMPGTCECVTNVAVSWEPDHISAWKHELRLETGMENISRDMAEGRFPERSDPLVVRMNPDEALAASPEVAKLIADAEARVWEQVRLRDQRIRELEARDGIILLRNEPYGGQP